MRENGLLSPLRLFTLATFSAIALLVAQVPAQQQPNPGNQLPSPKLLTISPAGAKGGTTLELTFTGTDLEDPQGLVFSHPSIRAEPIVPPLPPPDPKLVGPPKPVPPPPVTKFKVMVDP